MAFNAAHLALVVDSIAGGNLRIHGYETADSLATVTGTDYFTLGYKRGLREGDSVVVFITGAGGGSYVATVTNISAALHATVQAEVLQANVLDARAFGVEAGALIDNTERLRNGIAYAAARNAAVIQLPPGIIGITDSLIIEASNVFLDGCGGDELHDAGTGVSGATTLRTLSGGNPGAPMVWQRTPQAAGNAKRVGGGVRNMVLDANQIAPDCVRVTSRNKFVLSNLHFADMTRAGAYLTCYTTGQLAEPPDNQHFEIDRVSWRAIDYVGVRSAAGLLLSGSATSNTSFGNVSNCRGQTYNQPGINVDNADNVLLLNNSAAVLGSGAAAFGLLFAGSDANKVMGFSGTVKVAGVASGYAGNPRTNLIVGLDTGNGSTLTIDASCDANYWFDDGRFHVITPPGGLGPTVSGWTAASGVDNKGAFNADFSITFGGTYVQADAQALSDLVKGTRQRLASLERAVRARGLIDPYP